MTIATNMAGRGVDIKIDDRCASSAASTCSAPSGTRRAASTTSCAAAQGARAIPARRASTSRARTTWCACSRATGSTTSWSASSCPTTSRWRPASSRARSRTRRRRSRSRTSSQRKNVLKYDDVMNVQRQVIYEQRHRVLHGEDLGEDIREDWLPEVISDVVVGLHADELHEEWDLGALVGAMDAALRHRRQRRRSCKGSTAAIAQEFVDDALDAYAERETELEQIQDGLMRDLERFIVLQTVDVRWREHLENMDYMREGIHLRGMAQKDPLVEYRNEGHLMFQELNRCDPRGGRHAALPRRGDTRRGARCSSRRQRGHGSLSYEHESLAGADAILAAGGSSTAAMAGVAAVGRSTPVPAAEGELRARERRPQRSLPVRLRQEVQEVPRGLSAARSTARRRHPPARAAQLEAHRPELLALIADEADQASSRSCRRMRLPSFIAGWIRPLRGGLARRHARGVRRHGTSPAVISSPSLRSSTLDLEARQGRDRLCRRAGRARQGRGRPLGRAPHALGFRRARTDPARAAVSPLRTRPPSAWRSAPATAGGCSPLGLLQGGPAGRPRRVVPSARRSTGALGWRA